MAKQYRKEKSLLVTRFFLPLLIVFFGAVYLDNITHDVYGGDVGDLATAAFVGGVPHPPGYPLFTLLGWLFTKLPTTLPPVSEVALVSVISALGALVFFYKISHLLVGNKYISLLSTAILATSYHFWLYSEIPEVFVLNIFLTLAIVYFALHFYYKKNFASLLLLFLFGGLGMSNHQTVIFVSPLVLAILFVRRKVVFSYGKKLLLLPVGLLIGLLPYLYIPIAALQMPVLSWENPVTFENFVDLVTRRAYGTFSAGNFAKPVTELRILLLKDYFISVIASVSLPVIFVSILGIIYGVVKQRFLSSFLLATLVLSGPFFIFYAGFPLANTFILSVVERFYLFSEVVLLLFLPFGFAVIFLFFKRFFSKPLYTYVLMGAFTLIPLFLFLKNYERTDLSTLSIGTNFGKDYLRNLPSGAVIFIEGDTKAFNIWYAHFVLGFREDVEVVQVGGHAIRNDFFDTIYTANDMLPVEKQRENFLKALVQVSQSRQVFATSPLALPGDDLIWVPRGIGFRLSERKNLPTLKEYKSYTSSDFENIDIPERGKLTVSERNLTTSDIPTYYADAIVRIADFYYNYYADFSSAAKNYQYATVVDPNFSKGYAGLAMVQSNLGNCKGAEENIDRAISLLPVEKKYYQIKYINFSECARDLDKARDVASFYGQTFHVEIEKGLEIK